MYAAAAAHICTGPDWARRCPHLHQEWAHPGHICTGTGLTAKSPLPHPAARPRARLQPAQRHGVNLPDDQALARVPNDPHQPYLFHGEELARGCRRVPHPLSGREYT
jgi:hypothetical protein